jgi:tetratricopeptide (TPR) repeat protein
LNEQETGDRRQETGDRGPRDSSAGAPRHPVRCARRVRPRTLAPVACLLSPASCLLFAAAILLLPSPAAAAESSFAAANDAYHDGKFEDAIHQYEALVTAGVRHEDLYYNLGNAYYRAASTAANRLGPAIYNYERALRLSPGHEDAEYNLQVARDAVAAKVVDRITGAETDPLWVRAVTRFSVTRLTVAFLLLDALFFAALIAVRFLAAGFLRTGILVGSVFVGVGAVVCAIWLAGHLYFLERVELGIVLPDEIQLREGPDQRRAERGQVHAGLRVTLMARDQGLGSSPGAGWVRVRLANGHEGWLPQDAVGEL